MSVYASLLHLCKTLHQVYKTTLPLVNKNLKNPFSFILWEDEVSVELDVRGASRRDLHEFVGIRESLNLCLQSKLNVKVKSAY